MARTLYFVGGEDFDFNGYGTVSVDTDVGHRRPAFSRCALYAQGFEAGWDTGNVTGGLGSVWFHFRAWAPTRTIRVNGAQNEGDMREFFRSCWRIMDPNGAVRLMVGYTTPANFSLYDPYSPPYWWLAKVNEAGDVMRIGAVFSVFLTPDAPEPNAVDIQISNYDVTDGGSVKIYIDEALAYACSGQTLYTDANREIAGIRLGGALDLGDGTQNIPISYSEVVVAAEDTRNLSVGTLVPIDDGNTTNWTVGGVENINEIVLDDTTVNASDTAAQVQQYTIDAPPSGNYGVVAVVVAARGQKGSLSGPEHLDLGVRTGGGDYWGADIDLPIVLQRMQTVFLTNPGTGVGWSTAEIADANFNIGLQSAT